MSVKRCWFPLAIALSLCSVSQSLAGGNLEQGVDKAFAGARNRVSVGGHSYFLNPVKVQRTATGVKAEGYFSHDIFGRNDDVHYSIECNKGESYRATLVKIRYGGVLGRTNTLPVGAKWVLRGARELTGEIPVVGQITGLLDEFGEKLFKGLVKGVNAVQRRLIGNWEPTAVQVMDAMGKRLQRELSQGDTKVRAQKRRPAVIR